MRIVVVLVAVLGLVCGGCKGGQGKKVAPAAREKPAAKPATVKASASGEGEEKEAVQGEETLPAGEVGDGDEDGYVRREFEWRKPVAAPASADDADEDYFPYVEKELAGLEPGPGCKAGDVCAPCVVGHASTAGKAFDVALAGRYAVVAVGVKGIEVFSLKDPLVPVRVGGVETGGSARRVVVDRKLAYVADMSGGLVAVDLSKVGKPRVAGRLEVDGGDATHVTVEGDVAYVTVGKGVWVVDVSDPEAMKKVGVYEAGGRTGQVVVEEGEAYVACPGCGDGFVHVVDVTDPAKPRKVRAVGMDFPLDEFLVVGEQVVGVGMDGGSGFELNGDGYGVMYFGDGSGWGLAHPGVCTGKRWVALGWDGGVEILRVTKKGVAGGSRLDVPGDVRGLDGRGNLVYVAGGRSGLFVGEVGDPRYPAVRRLKQVQGESVAVAADGVGVYLARVDGEKTVVDLFDARKPVSLPRRASVVVDGVTDMDAVGGHLWMTGGSQVRYVDWSQRGKKVDVVGIDVGEGAVAVSAVDGGAVVAYRGGVGVVEGDEVVQTVDVDCRIRDVTASGRWAWVLCKGGLVTVSLDEGKVVGDLGLPARVQAVDTDGRSVVAAIGHAWDQACEKGCEGYVVVDVKDPAAPVVATKVIGGMAFVDVSMLEGMAILATAEIGPRVLDVRDPAQAEVILGVDVDSPDASDMYMYARSVAAHGDHVWVAGQYSLITIQLR